MALERSNPLPSGRYWQDVSGKESEAFNGWLSSNRASLHVFATEHTPALRTATLSHDASDWIAFEVLHPVRWQGPGLPTIIPPGVTVTSRADVEQAPTPPKDIPDTIDTDAIGAGIGNVVQQGIAVAEVLAGGLVAAGLYLYIKRR